MAFRPAEPGTAVADRLDSITAYAAFVRPSSATGVIEELLAAMLLRHQLNRPAFEYDDAGVSWSTSDTDQPASTEQQRNTADDPNYEPPPF